MVHAKGPFSTSDMIEMKQATCMFNFTNVGSNMCVKDNSDLFLNLMQSKEPIMAFMSLTGNYRMAGKVWEKYLRNWVKLTLYYVNNPCMAGEILAKALYCMTGESYDDSCAVNVSHYGRKVWSSY